MTERAAVPAALFHSRSGMHANGTNGQQRPHREPLRHQPLTTAVGVLSSHALGRGQRERVAAIVGQGFWVAGGLTITGILLSTRLYPLPRARDRAIGPGDPVPAE